MPSTPLVEKVAELLWKANIGYEDDILGPFEMLLSATERLHLVNHHHDPRVFFNKLTLETDQVIAGLKKHCSMLGGIRALSYFIPSMEVKIAEWELFCDATFEAIGNMIDMLQNIGVIFEPVMLNSTVRTEYKRVLSGGPTICRAPVSYLEGELAGSRSTHRVRLTWEFNSKSLGAA